jgi:type IV pilus assembly protein PilP
MYRLTCFLISLVLLQGCESSMQDTKSFVASVKQSKGIAIEQLPKPLTYEHYVYSASFSRSPFDVPQQELTLDVISQNRDCLQPDIHRRKSLLEANALDNLIMRGTLGTPEELWVLIQTADGDVYKVKQGNYIGLFHGKITQVSEQQIELTEIVPDGSGCWVERKNTLSLQNDA